MTNFANPVNYQLAYRRFAVAYIFVILDFNIKSGQFRFDIIPDWLGYLIMSMAAYSLRINNKYFSRMFWLTLVLMAVKVFDISAGSSVIFYGNGNSGVSDFTLPLVLIYGAFALYTDYMLFRGTQYEAQMLGSEEMENRARRLWKIYLMLFIVALIFAVIGAMGGNNTSAVPIFLAVLMIIIGEISVLFRLFRYARTLLPVAYENKMRSQNNI
ncbi:MAG: hypothetical protein MUC87_18815 [Bacteroidia bacterium]|jgi:hypothetical protein|nr:hypothetical protein [Bacteroidia bacterium]